MKPPVAKSPDAFRTIGEAAEEIGVPHHVLRFWEARFPQLQPMKRGGNRRYYRPADMDLLRTIHAMLHDRGLTIRGAQKALAEGGGSAGVIPAQAGTHLLTSSQDSAPPARQDNEPREMGPRLRGDDENKFDLTRLRAIRNRIAAALAA